MDITEIINEGLINFRPNAGNKEDAIEEMARMLAAQGKIDNVEEFIEEVRERETVSSTNTGIGVAIPHGKGPSVLRTSAAICRFDGEIPWDDENVKVVILLAVVDDEEGLAHLEVISRISAMLMDDDFLEVLFTASTKQELLREIEDRSKEET
jgi:PTS system fructose-specific IIA component